MKENLFIDNYLYLVTNMYLYDNKFTSLVTLILYLLDLKINPSNIVSEDNYEINLLDEPIYLELEKIDLIQIRNKLSNKCFHIIYYAFLSNNKNKEMIIYAFLKHYFIYKEKVYYYRNIDSVNDILKLCHKVGNEAHKMKGFLRFKLMKNNFYYANIEPTNNIISILANHFKKRLKNEYWIIHDNIRDIYALYDQNKVYYLNKDNIKKLNLDLSDDELKIEDLWSTFFKTIAIKERKNLKCQRNFMPKKYWKNMIEMSDINERSY